MIASKPSNLGHVEAASVPIAGQTAWQALFQHGHLERGQTVLIHGGSGGVGTFAVQLARWKGARVLATCSAVNADYLRSLGADEAIDYKAIPFESVAKNVDLVLDLIGGDTQHRSFGVLKAGGSLIATSQPPSQDEAAKRKVHALMMRMQPSTKDLSQLAKLLEAGTIKTLVSEEVSVVAGTRGVGRHPVRPHARKDRARRCRIAVVSADVRRSPTDSLCPAGAWRLLQDPTFCTGRLAWNVSFRRRGRGDDSERL